MVIESREDALGQCARRLVALNERFSLPVVRTSTDTEDLLDELVYFTLRNRSARLNADAAFRELRRRFPTWHQLTLAPRCEIEEAIRPAGLVHQRAELIQKLVARIENDFPDGSYGAIRTWDDLAILRYLTSLPGIGQFAAYQAMLYVLGRPVLPVAWPLTRLLTRLGIVDQSFGPEAVLDAAASLLATGEHRVLYDNLLEHARAICTPRTPRCRRCQLSDLCAYNKRVRLRRGLAALEPMSED
jgi:endonuclease III